MAAFRQTGPVAESKRSGRLKSVRTVANIEAVQEEVTRSPKKSARRLSTDGSGNERRASESVGKNFCTICILYGCRQLSFRDAEQ